MNIWNCHDFDIVLLLLRSAIKTPTLMMIKALDRLNGIFFLEEMEGMRKLFVYKVCVD
jgi:hypothetical protein